MPQKHFERTFPIDARAPGIAGGSPVALRPPREPAGLRLGTGADTFFGAAFLNCFAAFWGARLICLVDGAAFFACLKSALVVVPLLTPSWLVLPANMVFILARQRMRATEEGTEAVSDKINRSLCLADDDRFAIRVWRVRCD